jgi:hypothetical protein
MSGLKRPDPGRNIEGYRTRRDRGVDDHALRLKTTPNIERVPFGRPGPYGNALAGSTSNIGPPPLPGS